MGKCEAGTPGTDRCWGLGLRPGQWVRGGGWLRSQGASRRGDPRTDPAALSGPGAGRSALPAPGSRPSGLHIAGLPPARLPDHQLRVRADAPFSSEELGLHRSLRWLLAARTGPSGACPLLGRVRPACAGPSLVAQTRRGRGPARCSRLGLKWCFQTNAKSEKPPGPGRSPASVGQQEARDPGGVRGQSWSCAWGEPCRPC